MWLTKVEFDRLIRKKCVIQCQLNCSTVMQGCCSQKRRAMTKNTFHLCANMLTRRFTAGVSRLVTAIRLLLFNFLLLSCERLQFDPQTNAAAPVLALCY